MRFTIFSRLSGTTLLLWWAVTFFLTHTPLPEETQGIPSVDKLTHILMYAGLTFFFALWWFKSKPLTNAQIVTILALTMAYSLADETLQSFVGRDPNIADGIADMVGAIIGLRIYKSNSRA
jgi:VanZ family protein